MSLQDLGALRQIGAALVALAAWLMWAWQRLRRRMMERRQDRPLTMTEAATRLGAQTWQLSNVFARGLLPEADRLGRNRIVWESQLPEVEAALRKAGFLK